MALSIEAQFIRGVVNIEQVPQNNFPHIVFAGRSNVGKSSLINRLLNKKNIARTSKTPGKTREINFYLVNNKFYLVDLPGYGYARTSRKLQQEWGKLIEVYLSQEKNIALVLQLIDIRHPDSPLDKQLSGFLEVLKLKKVIIATKSDKLSRSRIMANLTQLKKGMNLAQNTSIIPFSSLNGSGEKEVWSVINNTLKNRKKIGE